MDTMVTVAVDAMGGDHAPDEVIRGAVDAVNEKENIRVLLVGREEVLKPKLQGMTYPEGRIGTVQASQVIETAEEPTAAIREKKDSSIVVGLKLVRDGQANGFVSAGNSGALLAGGIGILRLVPGVRRSPFGAIMPTKNGVSLILDAGANVDVRPEDLVQFARLGSIYMEDAVGIKNPKVGIVNIGAEDDKGNALVKAAFPLLKECPDINFTGSVEAREVPEGTRDVLVCDGFAGNCIIKTYEGAGIVFRDLLKEGVMSSFRSKLGALLLKPALKETLKKFDASAYGSAPMLGLRGLVVKAHGNCRAKQFKYSIFQVASFRDKKLDEKITANFEEDARKQREEKKAAMEARKAARAENKDTDQNS